MKGNLIPHALDRAAHIGKRRDLTACSFGSSSFRAKTHCKVSNRLAESNDTQTYRVLIL